MSICVTPTHTVVKTRNYILCLRHSLLKLGDMVAAHSGRGCRGKWVTWLPDGGAGAAWARPAAEFSPRFSRRAEQSVSARGLRRESLKRRGAGWWGGGGWGWPIIDENHLPEICTGAALNFISHSSSSHRSISWKRSNNPHTKRCCRSLLITLLP